MSAPSYPHVTFWALHRTRIDHVLPDMLKNWLAAQFKNPGGGYMSRAASSGSLPTRRCSSRSPTHSCGERTQDTPRSPTKTVCSASNLRRVYAILTRTIRRTAIAERIPFEILCTIAGELEDPPRNDLAITVSKHQKNQHLILMRNVCKTWRGQLLQSKLLWQDVSFDTTRRGTIEMAESFLDLLEKFSFNVYAIGSPGDLTGDAGVQLMARGLLLRLRRRVQDIKRCGFHTPSKEFCAYLDLPSSKVSYLNLSGTRESGTFSGDFPVLRELHVPASFFSSLKAPTFPELTTFSLRAQDTPTSLLWMLQLLRGMPRLTALLLEGFTDFDIDCGGEPTPKLLGLKTLDLTGCDFDVILSCFVAPNIRDCKISEFVLPHGEPTSIYRFFTSPPPTSATDTTPDQQEPSSLSISIYSKNITAFYMDLVDGDRKFTLSSIWTQPPGVWQSWTEQVLTALSARFRPTTGIQLYLSFTGPIPRSLYSPLLQLPHVTDLSIRSSSGVIVDTLRSLMALDDDLMPVALPTLRSLIIEGVLSFTDDEIDVVKAYMNFRSCGNNYLHKMPDKSDTP